MTEQATRWCQIAQASRTCGGSRADVARPRGAAAAPPSTSRRDAQRRAPDRAHRAREPRAVRGRARHARDARRAAADRRARDAGGGARASPTRSPHAPASGRARSRSAPAARGVSAGGTAGVLTTDLALGVQSWVAGSRRRRASRRATRSVARSRSSFRSSRRAGSLARLRRVATAGTIEGARAPAFHAYLIPCPPRAPSRALRAHAAARDDRAAARRRRERRRLRHDRDVTLRRDRERALAVQLSSPDDTVRLQACGTLGAEDGRSSRSPARSATRAGACARRGGGARAHGRRRRGWTRCSRGARAAPRTRLLKRALTAPCARATTSSRRSPTCSARRLRRRRAHVRRARARPPRGSARRAGAARRARRLRPNVRFHAIEARARIRSRAARPRGRRGRGVARLRRRLRGARPRSP